MSDAGRKGVTDQISEKMTPDSSKSTLEKASESVTSGADKVIGSVQPNDSKSTSQKLSDSTRSGADDAQNQGKSLYEQASDGVSSVVNSVSDAISGNSGTK